MILTSNNDCCHFLAHCWGDFSYLLSIVLSPAVLDGPEWNAITCTKKEKNILNTTQLCWLILYACKYISKVFWNFFFFFTYPCCLNTWSSHLYQYKHWNITHVVRIPQAAQRDQSSRGCRRSLEDETLPFCRTKDSKKLRFKKGNFK